MFVQVNLMQYMKLSTSRDFRINAATLEAALQEQDDSPDVSSSDESNTFTLNNFLDQCLVLFQTTESQQAEETQEPKQKKRKH